jgi:hypothetical protein
MDLKKVIEGYEKASNNELYEALIFLKQRFDSDKQRIVEISHQIDAIEKDYNKLYNEYKNRVKGNG